MVEERIREFTYPRRATRRMDRALKSRLVQSGEAA
jgi:hypothetical protein